VPGVRDHHYLQVRGRGVVLGLRALHRRRAGAVVDGHAGAEQIVVLADYHQDRHGNVVGGLLGCGQGGQRGRLRPAAEPSRCPRSLRRPPRLIAHAAIESYSVLTRLPPPHRTHPSIVHAFITERFTEPFLTLSETGCQELLATIAAGQILGGPAYDALIAFTAIEHQATLLSLDHRATPTYEAVGATVEQLAP
jgi:hypothetical protein